MKFFLTKKAVLGVWDGKKNKDQKMKNWVFVVISGLCLTPGFAQPGKISGHVYVDENSNGIYDKGETPLPNVSLSNGIDVVQTNERGEYEIPLLDDAVIFVIKPSGYIPGLTENNISNFFAYHKPKGSPKYKYQGIPKTVLSDPLDFAMCPNPGEDTVKVALLGDTQIEIIDDVYYVAKLVGEQLINEKVDFVVPLGDLVFDDLDLFDPLKMVLGKIGAPVYYVYGNHDRNYDATRLQYRDETFKAHFGPSYYAFNYGSVAFLVLNTVFPENGTRKFEGKIDKNQLRFIENYVKTLSFDTPIHFFMHVPLEEVSNLDSLFLLFKDHANVSAYAGHTHTQYFKYFGKKDGWPHNQPMTELVAGAVCGSWWMGEKDMYGVPNAMMGDGTPKGYWILDISGLNRNCTYKVSGNLPDKQMHIWTPHKFLNETAFLDNNDIIVNIYAGNDSTKVELKIEGKSWVPMQKVKAPDPYYTRLIKLLESGNNSAENTPYYRERFPLSSHIWKMKIPVELMPGVYSVKIRARNNNGLNAQAHTLLFVD